jgi:hypothetical protein
VPFRRLVALALCLRPCNLAGCGSRETVGSPAREGATCREHVRHLYNAGAPGSTQRPCRERTSGSQLRALPRSATHRQTAASCINASSAVADSGPGCDAPPVEKMGS